MEREKLKFANRLLDAKAQVLSQDQNGATVLHHAVEKGYDILVRRILNAVVLDGGSINDSSNDNNNCHSSFINARLLPSSSTAAHIAAFHGRTQVLGQIRSRANHQQIHSKHSHLRNNVFF